MITVETNLSKFAAAFAGVSERVFNKAYSHSANTALSKTRTYILQAFVQLGMKRKNIAPRLLVYKSNPNTLEARLYETGKKVPLALFNPRTKVVKTERGKRVGVTIEKDGQRILVPNAFLRTFKSGRVGIYERTGPGRFPWRQLYADSIGDIFRKTNGLAASSKAYAAEAFRTQFAKDFDYYKGKEIK